MVALLAAGGGFLLGVLWMDFLFDVQVLGSDPLSGLASIAAYYRRVTTEAYPLNRLIGAVMLATVAGAVYQLVRRRFSFAVGLSALLLAAIPIGLAIARVVPNAVRLGSGVDEPAAQLALARAICVDHLLCLGLMSAFVLLLVATSRRTP